MVAWYHLDEVAGSTVQDIAPAPWSMVNDFGTTKPGPLGPISGSSGPFPVPGHVGGAHYFWGPVPGGHYEEVAPVPANPSELDFGTGDFSIDAWIRDVGNGQKQAIVDKLFIPIPPNNNVGFALYIEGWFLTLHLNGFTFPSTGQITHANPMGNTGP